MNMFTKYVHTHKKNEEEKERYILSMVVITRRKTKKSNIQRRDQLFETRVEPLVTLSFKRVTNSSSIGWKDKKKRYVFFGVIMERQKNSF